MNEKELISQLHSLRSMTPDADWKEARRCVLLNQISGAAAEEAKMTWSFGRVVSFFDVIVQPAGLAVFVFVLLAVGSVSSMVASRNAKPGDSLYIAKMIGEKTRSTLAFDDKNKAKLNLEFASNRAKEISQVLAEPKKSEEEKAVQVEKLTQSFQSELESAKVKIEKIAPRVAKQPETPAVKPAVLSTTTDNGKIVKNDPSDAAQNATTADEIFSANLGKDGTGEQVSGGQTDTKQMIEEVEKLFENKDYDGAADKLEQVNDIIDKVQAQSEVKGESEQASSTK